MATGIYGAAWVALFKGIRQLDLSGGSLMLPLHHSIATRKTAPGGDGDSEVDTILNIVAALLALTRLSQDAETPTASWGGHTELRISRGNAALARQLLSWHVEASIQVDSEILVLTLLALLEAEGIISELPGRNGLMDLYDTKIKTFHPNDTLWIPQHTLLHFLEAFVGKIDFDKVSHHLIDGHMMASPSSTAADLMSASQWDAQAESYLETVL
jgi:hypothetical protein